MMQTDTAFTQFAQHDEKLARALVMQTDTAFTQLAQHNEKLARALVTQTELPVCVYQNINSNKEKAL